jgi:hypothetical protein
MRKRENGKPPKKYPYQGYVLPNLGSSLLNSFHILPFQTKNSGPSQNSAHFCVHWPEVQMKFSILTFSYPNKLYNKRRFIVNIFLFPKLQISATENTEDTEKKDLSNPIPGQLTLKI